MDVDPNEGCRVDKEEIGIRLGCGGIFGLLVGGYFALRWTAGNLWIVIPVAVASAIFSAVLAARHGDTFWRRISEKLWWMWPVQ